MSRINLDVGPVTRIRAIERAIEGLLTSTIVGSGGVVVTGSPATGFSLSVPFANNFEFIAYDTSKAVNSATVKTETDLKLNRSAKATGAEAIAGTDIEKWVGPYALKQAINAKIVEVAASENPDLEAISELIEDRMASDFTNAAFDSTGARGAARGDLSNTRALGALVKAPAGTADCYQAIMDASDRLDGKPGRIILPQDQDVYLRSDLDLPDGQILQGWHSWGSHVFENTDVLGPKLWVDPDVSVFVGNGCGVDSLPVLRAGLILGQPSAQRYATWLGTAFLLKESTSDHYFRNMAILGFLNGVQSENTTAVLPGQNITNNRSHFQRLLMNNINEIWLHNSADVARFFQLHLWPAAQYQAAHEAADAHIKSTGTGIKLTGLNDHTQFDSVFTFGKYRGFDIKDAAHVILNASATDYPPGSGDGSLGLLIHGAASEIKVNNFRASGTDYGVEVNATTTDAVVAMFDNPTIWGITTHALRSLQGDVQVIGGSIREDGHVAQGVVTGPNSGVTTILGTDIRGFSTGVSNYSTATVTRLREVAFSDNTADTNNAFTDTKFTTFAPAATSTFGAFGDPGPTVTCQYVRDRDEITANYNISVPANGSADGELRVPLPVAHSGGLFAVGIGRDVTMGGLVVGTIASGSNYMAIVKGTGSTYPVSSGSVLAISVTYKG